MIFLPFESYGTSENRICTASSSMVTLSMPMYACVETKDVTSPTISMMMIGIITRTPSMIFFIFTP